jgi:prepilin-type N-terminal cleavage/methylation domain-containing protein
MVHQAAQHRCTPDPALAITPERARPRAHRAPTWPARGNVSRSHSVRTLLRPGTGALREDSQDAHRAAFTLIELMVVMVLIGIMTALILPEMKGTYEDALLRSASRELVSVCGLASSHAVSVNQVHRLRFDPRTGHYSIQRRAEERGPESGFVSAREVPGGEGELDTRIVIEIHKVGGEPAEAGGQESSPVPGDSAPAGRGDDGITFYPDGTADASEIVLRDRDGFRLALRINPVTARVRIIELARE